MIDLDKVVNTSLVALHGEPVAYTPFGGSVFTIPKAVFREGPEMIDDGEFVEVAGRSPRLGFRLTDVLAAGGPVGFRPDEGDLIVVKGRSFKPVAPFDPDHTGWFSLKLQKATG